jgi:hypothetical protein
VVYNHFNAEAILLNDIDATVAVQEISLLPLGRRVSRRRAGRPAGRQRLGRRLPLMLPASSRGYRVRGQARPVRCAAVTRRDRRCGQRWPGRGNRVAVPAAAVAARVRAQTRSTRGLR